MDCRHLIITVLFAAAVCACAKRDPFERELGLQSRLVELSAENGITPVMVFSNTAWKAKFVTPVDWASLDRLSGEGSSEVRFAYADNYGRARKVSIAFEAGAAKDTLVLIQASGVPSPFISLNPSSLNVGADVSSCKVILSTNIQENLSEIEASVSYPDGEKDWINNVSFTETSLVLSLSPNSGAVARKATVTLSHSDARGEEITAQLFITQNPA
ncbi:MAG: hypothetical protein IKR69_02260 [Bacteroidales bacterium]|nr:hypothetical protein [Bacteroidales bacterium]